MKTRLIGILSTMLALASLTLAQAAPKEQTPFPATTKIIFLHHSTGEVIWNGGVADWFTAWNKAHGTRYTIAERAFPSGDPYPWNNYPYDYWNIWVKHAGAKAYQTEPTLEMLVKDYQVIVFKHCFPVSGIDEDGTPDIASEDKTLANYKLQYNALRTKLRSFPNVRFVVWTGAALLATETSPEQADRAKQFFDWGENQLGRARRQHLRMGLLRPRDRGWTISDESSWQRGLAPEREVRCRGCAALLPTLDRRDRRKGRHRGHHGRRTLNSLTLHDPAASPSRSVALPPSSSRLQSHDYRYTKGYDVGCSIESRQRSTSRRGHRRWFSLRSSTARI